MTEITYRGVKIELGTDEFFLYIEKLNGAIDVRHQYGNNLRFRGDTLEEKAKTCVDIILEEQQEQISLQELKETVEVHEDVINDAILRGVL